MKEFLVGLLALVVLSVMAGLYFLLFPFFILLALALKVAIVIFVGLFSIWLLGKIILMIFEKPANKVDKKLK